MNDIDLDAIMNVDADHVNEPTGGWRESHWNYCNRDFIHADIPYYIGEYLRDIEYSRYYWNEEPE